METADSAASWYELHLQTGQQGFQPGLYVRRLAILVDPLTPSQATLCCTVCHSTVGMNPFNATVGCRATWQVRGSGRGMRLGAGLWVHLMLCIARAKVELRLRVGLGTGAHSIAEGSCIV